MRRPVVLASPGDAVRAHRVGGVLALTVSALGVVLGLGLSSWSRTADAVLLVMLAAVAALGAAALLRPERMPAGTVVVALSTGTAFLSVGMVVAGREAVVGADNEMLYLVPVLYSAYFCRGWVVGLVTATASASYGLALLALDVPAPGTSWATTTGALSTVAALLSLTRARDIRLLSQAAEQARLDPLTGLLNRRGLLERAGDWPADEQVALLLVDLDHFKAVNDEHGHLVGDQVLVRVALALRAGLRGQDALSRFGGEEFVLVLHDCGLQEAGRRAQLLCDRVAAESRDWPVPVSLSVGVASGSAAGHGLDALLAGADRALYAAKAAGRNRVRVDASDAAWAVPPQGAPASARTP